MNDIDTVIKNIQQLQVLAALQEVAREADALNNRLARLEARKRHVWLDAQCHKARSYQKALADGAAFIPDGTKAIFFRGGR